MNNAIGGSAGNVTTTFTNGSVPYWEYAALLQPLSPGGPRTLATANQEQSGLHYRHHRLQQLQQAPAFSHSENQTRTQADIEEQASDNSPLSSDTHHANVFYSSFNISDDLFYYFNGYLGHSEDSLLPAEAVVDSSTSSTEGANYNITTPSVPVDELNLAEFLHNLPKDRVSLLSFLLLFSFATVFGNSLVILAVVRERYLHTATNYFITSLAVADCLVGLVVMPFSALYEVLDNTWFFGTDWCDIWRSLDVLFSTASILNLCVISLDRYWAITDPFSYPMRMTVKRAALLICAVWICSSAISFPAIVWWRAARDGEMPAYKCTFTEHLGYLVFSSTISFYLPLLVMVFTYWRIYRAAVIQTRSLKIGTKQVLMASGELQLTLRIHRGGTTRVPATSSHHQTLHGSLGGGSGLVVSGSAAQDHPHSHHHHHTSSHHNQHNASGTNTSTPEEPDDEPLSALHNNGLARHRHMGGKNFSLSRKLAKFAKEKKAAKTLGIVMGVFIVCWLPFFVVNLLSGFCMECIEHEEIVSAVVTWLGWINSCMNPVIYACWSRDFRRAFVRLLCVCCPRKIRRKYQPTMRSKSQPSSCSSCSGSSNCGRNGILQQQQQHHHYQPPQRERSCSRCQSFHRHHHRQRRRSSALYYGSTISNTSKAIVTITPPPPLPSSSPPTSLTTVTNTIIATKPSSSNLSISSPLTLNTQHNNNGSPTQTVSCTNFNEKLSPKTAAASTASKHCAFALTHITIQSPLHQLPTSVRHRSNSSIKNSTVQVSSAIADSQTLEVREIVNSDNIDEPDKIEISEVIDNDLHHDSSLSSFCSSKSSREVDCRRDSLV